MATIVKIRELLGNEADHLLKFNTPKIPKEQIHVPGPDWVERIFTPSDRPTPVLRSLQTLFGHGRLGAPAICPSCP